ncbi:MAG: Holliday junction resolvase RuvX [Nitriliruptorales bacterium]|nr:Holliday junction resolvase RuvX [Nitriliruptorales bacterium]
MRVMGVDVGTIRVGIALSDESATVASPYETVPRGDDVALRLADLARQLSCETVVVGLPRNLKGRDTASTRDARDVAHQLSEQGFDVHFWDERLSSAEAERVLLAAGRRREQRREERDRIAAAIILQGWLDARPLS